MISLDNLVTAIPFEKVEFVPNIKVENCNYLVGILYHIEHGVLWHSTDTDEVSRFSLKRSPALVNFIISADGMRTIGCPTEKYFDNVPVEESEEVYEFLSGCAFIVATNKAIAGSAKISVIRVLDYCTGPIRKKLVTWSNGGKLVLMEHRELAELLPTNFHDHDIFSAGYVGSYLIGGCFYHEFTGRHLRKALLDMDITPFTQPGHLWKLERNGSVDPIYLISDECVENVNPKLDLLGIQGNKEMSACVVLPWIEKLPTIFSN